jgi:cysteinylglycine-S-conjugate dipeptidase
MTDSAAAAEKAVDHLGENWDLYLKQLEDLVRIPGVSAKPPPNAEVEKSAAAVVALMQAAGLEGCEVIAFPGGHPYAYGEWLHAEGAPTVLLYGHHDVQPPGRPEKWETPAFEPTWREDGRLYGRGAVDDKAGVMMHVAACAAWLKTAGKLPLNVKFIVEGEEEAGSQSLGAFLEQYQEKLAADVIVLTDTANLDAGIPSLTTSLRGNVGCTVEVRALEQPIHSGMWGGPVPDPVIGLSRAVAELVDAQGRPAFDGAWNGVRPLNDAEREALGKLPFDEAAVRRDIRLAPGAELVGDPEVAPWGRIFRQPSVTVIAFEARALEGSTNQIIESARCKVSVRIVPDQDPEEIQAALVRHFESRVPWGLEVKVTAGQASGWWITDPEGPAFEAACRALQKGFGREAVFIGCGGSIPFVEPFARVLGGVPALLMGVEDPPCNAHGENESLNVDDWKAGTRAAAYLYAELAAALGGA